ncbi:MAG: hypothetical protein ACD_14C00054G0005 [uncultured bacterium]|nr:MAG: hypothetical protein ACD_14C00054G0005 [uncultured bacterium]KKQ46067.1 MAG: hypothetical protein US63_C0007G0044 [Candidatus Moranbacteria bacterium GW2011_GWC2_37_8]KKQ62758.1 MAG: hypothetical protein US82_C0006G0006 [Parcubacteria group bacterium GW2011_GWC1_38_22]
MKNIKFTNDGYDALARVVLSCYPVHQELNIQAMQYLKKAVTRIIEFDCETLMEKLPALKVSILEFAKEKKYREISKDVIVEFFAGGMHYEKILLDFEEYKLHIAPGSLFSLMTMFAHLAVPVELMGYEVDGYVGRYKKGQFDFPVQGLVATNKDKMSLKDISFENPKTVLVHFAMIIDINPSTEKLAQIRAMQESAEMFFRGCVLLQSRGGANYNRFPSDCRKKTEKALENISLQ